MPNALWLPLGSGTFDYNSIVVDAQVFYRKITWYVGVCKCGHQWIMHFHNNNPGRPGTSCDEYRCKCKKYRFRRLRKLGGPKKGRR